MAQQNGLEQLQQLSSMGLMENPMSSLSGLMSLLNMMQGMEQSTQAAVLNQEQFDHTKAMDAKRMELYGNRDQREESSMNNAAAQMLTTLMQMQIVQPSPEIGQYFHEQMGLPQGMFGAAQGQGYGFNDPILDHTAGQLDAYRNRKL